MTVATMQSRTPIGSQGGPVHRVIAYTYEFAKPINLTPYVTQLSAQLTMAASTRDTTTIAADGVEVPRWLAVGDWIQIDLVPQDGPTEHVFFGSVKAIGTPFERLGEGGGVSISTTITVETWAAALETWRKDVRAYFQLRARDLVSGAPDFATSFPTLAAIAADVPGAIAAPPWVQVAMLMEVLARYGGTMRQPYDLPESFLPGQGAISLLSLICKLNHRRKNGRGDVLRPADQIAGGIHATDLPNHNVAFVAGLANRADESWANSAWLLSDWHRTFVAHPHYPIGNAIMDELLQIDGQGSVWAAMSEYADTPWTQMYASLVEAIDYHGSAVTLEAHDGTTFERRFLLAVALHPVPHPVYQSTATPIVTDDRGFASVEADATGYGHRPIVIAHVGGLESANLSRSLDTLHNYWSVLPMDAAFRGIAQYDAAWLGSVSSWRFPIIDADSVRVHGYLPMELETKFWLDPTATSFWTILARKMALQYAWTAHGCNEVRGSVTMPLRTANIPRPADVLLLVGDRSTGSIHHAGDTATGRNHAVASPLSALLDARPGPDGGALSGYVESVQLVISVDPRSGLVSGSVDVQITQGSIATLPGGAEHAARHGGYNRVVQLSEVGLAARWWLPYSWGIDIFLRLQGLEVSNNDPTLSARTTAIAKAWTPVVREVAPRRATPRRAARPPATPVGDPVAVAPTPTAPTGVPFLWIGPEPTSEPRRDGPRKQANAPKPAPVVELGLPPAGWNKQLL